MAHSLIGADRGTHCKIVAVALAAATAVVLVAVGAKVADDDAPRARFEVAHPVLEAGRLVISAALDRTTIR